MRPGFDPVAEDAAPITCAFAGRQNVLQTAMLVSIPSHQHACTMLLHMHAGAIAEPAAFQAEHHCNVILRTVRRLEDSRRTASSAASWVDSPCGPTFLPSSSTSLARSVCCPAPTACRTTIIRRNLLERRGEISRRRHVHFLDLTVGVSAEHMLTSLHEPGLQHRPLGPASIQNYRPLMFQTRAVL